MGIKHTIEFVRKDFESNGYQLLSDEYVNCKQKLKFKCNNGHIHFIGYSMWRSGRRCGLCSVTKKKKIEEIKNSFEKEGYQLLTMEYINNNQKLMFICPNNHKHSISYGSWYIGSRCGLCKLTKKKTIEEVSESFKKERYKLLTTTYINSRQKLKFICPNNHKHSISYDAWKMGERCTFCVGTNKKTIEEIRKAFGKENYQLLTNEYKNAHDTKLKYICPTGHSHQITWMDWAAGNRCRFCGIKRSAQKRRIDINLIKKSFADEGYRLLVTKYKNAQQRLEYICPNKHRHYISWSNWCGGKRCPHCIKLATKTFNEVKEIFNAEGFELLETEYHDSRQKLNFICPRGHRHNITFFLWSKRGIRCGVCFREDRVGANHPMWKGGLKPTPYCLLWINKEYREYLNERDKDKHCWNPQCQSKTKLVGFHHINYNKKDCDPLNIIKLCRSCNGTANANRDWWQAFYAEIMRRRFDNGK